MTANIDAMLRAGVESYRAGNKLEARTMLEKVLELDEYNEMAWLWLSGVVDTPEEKRTCLENVVVINPNNENAKKGLMSLGVTAPQNPPTPTTKTGTGPFGAITIDEDDEVDDEPPTASSSASAIHKGKERGGSDYDQWISGLGIGGTDAKAPTADTPFGGEMFDDRLDNLFEEDDFDSAPVPAPPPVVRKTAPAPSKPAPAPILDDDEDYGDPFMDDEEVDFDVAVSQNIHNAEDMSLFETDMFDEDYEEEAAGPDPTEFFKLIPKEIKATRLPGERETYPKPLIAGIGLLVILNIGALIFLGLQLS